MDILVSLHLSYLLSYHKYQTHTDMSDLAWAVKNGDLDQVKEMVDVKVSVYSGYDIFYDVLIIHVGGGYQPADRWQAACPLCK